MFVGFTIKVGSQQLVIDLLILLKSLPICIFFITNKSFFLFIFKDYSFVSHNHIDLKTILITWHLFKMTLFYALAGLAQ